MGKTVVIFRRVFRNVARQKRSKSANVSRNYLKNKSGLVFETQCSKLRMTRNWMEPSKVCVHCFGYKLQHACYWRQRIWLFCEHWTRYFLIQRLAFCCRWQKTRVARLLWSHVAQHWRKVAQCLFYTYTSGS